jgi:hypothetical protein
MTNRLSCLLLFVAVCVFALSQPPAFLFLFARATSTQSENQGQLTNESIINLTKAGVSEAAIISLIQRSPTKFALDPDSIIRLRSHDSSVVSNKWLDNRRTRLHPVGPPEGEEEPVQLILGHYTSVLSHQFVA